MWWAWFGLTQIAVSHEMNKIIQNINTSAIILFGEIGCIKILINYFLLSTKIHYQLGKSAKFACFALCTWQPEWAEETIICKLLYNYEAFVSINFTIEQQMLPVSVTEDFEPVINTFNKTHFMLENSITQCSIRIFSRFFIFFKNKPWKILKVQQLGISSVDKMIAWLPKHANHAVL